jgi:dihydroorotate dehydrogenase electron transfer subunit
LGQAVVRLATLVKSEPLFGTQYLLTLEFAETVEFSPGQFVMIRGVNWGTDPFLPRPMSLLRSEGSFISILVREVGKGTSRLVHSRVGDSFSVTGPLGKPWGACSEGLTPVLVAGGVGVCPLVSLYEAFASQDRDVEALYGGRCLEDLVLRDWFRKVRLVSEPAVVTDYLPETLSSVGKAKVYACGPIPMLRKVVRICREAGVPCEVSLEARMACGVGICLGCAVPSMGGGYLYACTDGPCVDGGVVDWERVRDE